MRKLKEELDREISRSTWVTRHKPPVRGPANGQSVKISFSKSIVADVVGTAATELLDALESKDSSSSSTALPSLGNLIVVNENFKIKAVRAEEVGKYTPCRMGKLTQRLLVPVPPAGLNIRREKENGGLLRLIAPFVQEVFDAVSSQLIAHWTTHSTPTTYTNI